MLQILKFALIFLGSKLVGCSCILVPSAWEPPIRVVELEMLHKVATQGPGGFDDAAQMTLINAPEKYAGGVAKLLNESSPGDDKETVGLYFAEMVVEDLNVRGALEGVMTRHEDKETKALVAAILATTHKKAHGK